MTGKLPKLGFLSISSGIEFHDPVIVPCPALKNLTLSVPLLPQYEQCI
jgi:hypothetical protein